MPPVVTPSGPGTGEGWTRLAAAIRERLPVAEIDGVWIFRILRRDGREFGTAVLSRVDGSRRRIYTARFALTVKGKTRGQFALEVQEAGSGPLEALDQVLALVPERAEDEEPPIRIPVEIWFRPDEVEAPGGE